MLRGIDGLAPRNWLSGRIDLSADFAREWNRISSSDRFARESMARLDAVVCQTGYEDPEPAVEAFARRHDLYDLMAITRALPGSGLMHFISLYRGTRPRRPSRARTGCCSSSSARADDRGAGVACDDPASRVLHAERHLHPAGHRGLRVFPMPIGRTSVAMVDARDIADIAVAELLRRDRAVEPLPTIHYGGDDVGAFEAQLTQHHDPVWMAYDLRLMMERIQQVGQIAAAGAVRKLEEILGRPMRTYQAFVAERVKKH